MGRGMKGERRRERRGEKRAEEGAIAHGKHPSLKTSPTPREMRGARQLTCTHSREVNRRLILYEPAGTSGAEGFVIRDGDDDSPLLSRSRSRMVDQLMTHLSPSSSSPSNLALIPLSTIKIAHIHGSFRTIIMACCISLTHCWSLLARR